MQKKLYKDPDRKMISGVLAGISDYINVDVTIVRILYVILSFISTAFPGIILYIILAVVMPNKEDAVGSYRNDNYRDNDRRESTHYETEQKTYHDADFKDVPPSEDSAEKKSYTKSGGSYTSDK
ncbi:MAG: PspC domain-containing protein [Clostridium sp.]|nr:PspC domain-containing protein [Clostridium sp.]